jgi:hypothetical protein
MSSKQRRIRPFPAELRGMPTLAVETADDGTDDYRALARELCPDLRMELKLETPEERYWLCTRGLAGDRPGAPQSWIVGNVTIDFLSDESRGETTVYGPGDVVALQRIDYGRMIRKELDELCDAQEREPTTERANRIAELRGEFRRVYKAEFDRLDPDHDD